MYFDSVKFNELLKKFKSCSDNINVLLDNIYTDGFSKLIDNKLIDSSDIDLFTDKCANVNGNNNIIYNQLMSFITKLNSVYNSMEDVSSSINNMF